MAATSARSNEVRMTPAGERILSAASELFYRHGIGAVGVDAVAEAAGVTKKTLYDRFGSKGRLIAAYLRARDLRWREHVERYVGAAGGTGERLLTVFDALADWMWAENSRGCAFVHAYAELTDPAHPGRQVVREQKQWLSARLTDLARDADVPDPELLAARLLLLHEGATVAYGMGIDADAASTARSSAAALLAAAL